MCDETTVLEMLGFCGLPQLQAELMELYNKPVRKSLFVISTESFRKYLTVAMLLVLGLDSGQNVGNYHTPLVCQWS